MVITLFTAALALCMVAVILFDAARYIIPNNLNLLLLLLYGVAIFTLPVNPLWALLAASIVLAFGLGLFALGLMGGGDIKLLAVLTLWTGWGMATINFIIMTAIFGGLLVIVVLLARAIFPPILFRIRPSRNIPRLLTKKQPVPYGLAIAGAFLFMLLTHQVPGLGA